MTRPKTISDQEILMVARKLFRAQGHAASTREIARAAEISEGVLYQRFGSKDELFFAAMAPGAPDLEHLLGPEHPSEDAHAYLRGVVVRMAAYFGEVLPLALRVMTHPSFDRATLGHAHGGLTWLQEGLARRLSWFGEQKRIRKLAAEPVAQLLVSLAHDWALGQAMSLRPAARRAPELEAMVDVLWNGAAPAKASRATKR